MTEHRLSLALGSGALSLPPSGRICLHGANAEAGLHRLDDVAPERLLAIQGFRPEHDALARQGLEVTTNLPEPESCAAVLVQAPRARARAHQMLAEAWEMVAPGGLILLDGQKTDGIEGLQKDLRKRLDLEGVFSKAHGKLVWFNRGEGAPLADWSAPDIRSPEGFETRAGVFSAEAVDPGSALLLKHLPPLKGRVADLGAGWGYLARGILQSPDVTHLDLVEADRSALDCARANIDDPRSQFLWEDATEMAPPAELYHTIVTNPPFHVGRAAQPALGAAFITRAARLLRPSGVLWLVANRHLPYEAPLAAAFGRVETVTTESGYKVMQASKPRRSR
ncbi:hypothetical protein BV394_07080 [Brevirhabdus pacifica]|uniref:Uncharacterized protein n=1 Tax=Brevirhabdus pacifica TaxID=1267768 RepID=A0A1U7DHM6_9RHOB|nr:methyltransferase [Brevirhabdus pacifica]APX89507.1 hypothetical protein BV394_07080 [Brevirhabdus pacifica]OWU76485.1 hypothetical protein ATO5_09220 [Loktanella sp. 22II-4b]PJJ85840.1 16S rRNA m(2)G 1207 methyltransferase [Brevirhabdus pacifica]